MGSVVKQSLTPAEKAPEAEAPGSLREATGEQSPRPIGSHDSAEFLWRQGCETPALPPFRALPWVGTGRAELSRGAGAPPGWWAARVVAMTAARVFICGTTR